ncbi:MAG: anti-sigma factor family protein [bacterium]
MRDFFNCQECVELLTDYLEGTLDNNTKSRLDEHLSACAPCINFVKTFEKSADITKLLREQRVDVPAEVQDRVKSFLKDEIRTLLEAKKKPK